MRVSSVTLLSLSLWTCCHCCCCCCVAVALAIRVSLSSSSLWTHCCHCCGGGGLAMLYASLSSSSWRGPAVAIVGVMSWWHWPCTSHCCHLHRDCMDTVLLLLSLYNWHRWWVVQVVMVVIASSMLLVGHGKRDERNERKGTYIFETCNTCAGGCSVRP